MFQLNSFVNEIKNIGRQMAEKINEPFDEERIYIQLTDKDEASIVYYGYVRNTEVVIRKTSSGFNWRYKKDE